MAALPPIVSTPVTFTPLSSVKVANEVARDTSAEPAVRQIAASIVRGCRDVPRLGPELIARWIRRNIQYTQEAYGQEIIQGPVTTITLRTGDCDDLATTWAALCRSVGLPAVVVGLTDNGTSFFHAVGYDPMNRRLVELSKDWTYGGHRRGHAMAGLPSGSAGMYWDPEESRFVQLRDHEGAPALSGMRGPRHGDGANLSPAEIGAQLQAAGIRIDPEMLRVTPTLSAGVDLGVRAAGAAASATATVAAAAAAVGGVSAAGSALGAAAAMAAAPPAGTIVAAAAIMGVLAAALVRRGKLRKSARQAAVDVAALVDAVTALSAPPDQASADALRTRLLEVIPHLSETYGERGRRTRRVRIAAFVDARPYGAARWTDGSQRARMGVFEVFRNAGNGSQKMDATMAAHVATLRSIGQSLSQVPLAERRAALAVAIVSTLGSGGLSGLGWLYPRGRVPADAGPARSKAPYLLAAAAAALAVSVA